MLAPCNGPGRDQGARGNPPPCQLRPDPDRCRRLRSSSARRDPGRASPRVRLQSPQTTSTSMTRSGRPSCFLSHALGRWSSCRSSDAPQSLHHGCCRLMLSDSCRHAWSYPRLLGLRFFSTLTVRALFLCLSSSVSHCRHRDPSVVGVPHDRQGFLMSCSIRAGHLFDREGGSDVDVPV